MAVKRYNGTDWVTEAGATPPTTATGFRNAIINGDFRIWQRGSSFTPATGGGTYTADRWAMTFAGGTPTNSVARTAFTPGIASTLGVEAEYFHKSTITSVGTTTRYSVEQRIEDVKTFAGQTVTSSFWAKADSNRTLRVYLLQNFGTGGSTGVVVGFSDFNLTTSWQKFTFSTLVPSISGKTIGTNSNLNVRFDQAVAAGSVLDLWGVQLEEGSIATPFEQRPIGTELALCQRYYYRLAPNANSQLFAFGAMYTTTIMRASLSFPVEMRAAPTALETSGTASHYSIGLSGVGNYVPSSVPSYSQSSTRVMTINLATATTLTANAPATISSDATTGANAYLGFSAEL